MAKKNLSNVDAAWLHMEDPTNLMMINGYFKFDGPMDYQRLRDTIVERLLSFDRFKQRVAEPRRPFGSPYWETDPTFDLDAHLHRVALPAPGDDAVLIEMVNYLASTPLDFSKPLWEFHLIENYGDGCVLFCRLHHAIADGIALMYVMLSLCDEEPDAPWQGVGGRSRRRRGAVRRMFSPAFDAVNTSRMVAGAVVGEGVDWFFHPDHIKMRARQATDFLASLARLTFLPPDPKTSFKGRLGVTKHVAWSQPLPLEDIKLIKNALGATVNDVLMTIVSGALGRYLWERGEDVTGIDIRAMVPVNLRPPEKAYRLGNHFGLVVLALPMGIPGPLERLLVVKKRMDELKNSPEAIVGFTILNLMGLAPSQIETSGVEFFASKATLVLTNVPGPEKKLYFAGRRIEELMFWVPQSGRLGVGVSILSYAGNVVVGVITDAGLAPEPGLIARNIQIEYETMLDEARQVMESTYKGPVHLGNGERGRCKAMTKAGEQCRNSAVAGSAYCHIHANIVMDSEDMARR
ncbi:MAG: wax ester/triacylglycerol synthase family O-acyltransferase [Caldilineales bacterium]|nr:wax ester/triacylglycerol synthase family O-acyltransferase [Caldilineales bacterium]